MDKESPLVEMNRGRLPDSRILGEIEITERNKDLNLRDLLAFVGIRLHMRHMWEPGDKIQIIWRFDSEAWELEHKEVPG